MAQMETQKEITAQIILGRLQQRVSMNNAKLILDSAKVSTGVLIDNAAILSQDQAKTLCLKLIQEGGPAFQVGQAIYKEYLM